MDRITRRLKDASGSWSDQEFIIYERSEAERAGIDFKEDWRDCRVGDWGLTDDGYVLICRSFKELTAKRRNRSGKVKEKKHLKRRFYKFAVGEPIVGMNLNTGNIDKPSFEYLPFKENGGYSCARGQRWDETESRKTRTKNAMALWVDAHISSEGKITWEQKVQAAALYKPDNKHPVLTWEKFVYSKGGQELFMEMLKEALDKRGITYDGALMKLEETYQQAKEANHTQVMRGVAKDYLELLDKSEGMNHAGDDDDGYDFSMIEGALSDNLIMPSIGDPGSPEDGEQGEIADYVLEED